MRHEIESFLDFLRWAGLTVEVAGDKLRVSPAERITPELRQHIITHKVELLAELSSASEADKLIRESKAEWTKHVSAASYPQKWDELFADVEPGADLRVWTMDLERGIAYGPGGIVIA